MTPSVTQPARFATSAPEIRLPGVLVSAVLRAKSFPRAMLNAPLRAIFLLLAFAPAAVAAAQDAGIEKLAERLGSSSKETRRQAAFELARLGPGAEPALGALVKALGDRDQQVLFQVAQALAGIGPAAAPAVAGLVNNLKSRDRQVSYRSAYALGRIGKPAVPALIEVLGSSSSRARATAARALSWVQPAPPGAAEKLVEVLGDDDKDVRRNASEALGSYGMPVAPRLAAALRSENAMVRRGASRALSLMGAGAKPAAGALAAALTDEDPGVRAGATSAISKTGIGAGKLVPLLMGRLEDSEAAVRSAAVQALSRQKPSDVTRELVRLLEGGGEATVQAVALVAERLGGRARAVLPGLLDAAVSIEELSAATPLARALAAFAEETAALVLKRLAGPQGAEEFPRLRRVLGFTAASSTGALRKALASGPALVRLGAAAALGEGGDAGRDATPELLGALKDKDPRLRAAAIGSLAALGVPANNYTDALLSLVEDPDEKVRAAAVSAAGKMDKDQLARLVPVLKRSLSDSSVEIRRAAAASLAEVGPAAAGARPLLLAALKDPDPLVRARSARALGALGGNGGEMVGQLLMLLEEKDPAVRLEAIRALGGFSGGMGRALGPLLALAVSSKEAEALRLAAIETLAQISSSSDPLPGIDGAQEALVSLLKKAPVKVRVASARALVACRPDTGRAVAALAVAVRDDNPDVKRAAVESAGAIGPAAQGAAGAIFDLLGDEYTRAMGFEALKKIEPRDVSLLRKALGHKDRYVRGFACSCLGKLGAGAKDALGDLRKASRTRSRTLRDLIQKTIKKIEDDIQRNK